MRIKRAKLWASRPCRWKKIHYDEIKANLLQNKISILLISFCVVFIQLFILCVGLVFAIFFCLPSSCLLILSEVFILKEHYQHVYIHTTLQNGKNHFSRWCSLKTWLLPAFIQSVCCNVSHSTVYRIWMWRKHLLLASEPSYT